MLKVALNTVTLTLYCIASTCVKGKGDIVHFGGVDISSTAVDSSCCSAFTKCGTGHRKASVEKETFMKVAGQSKAQKNNDKDKTTPLVIIIFSRKV